MLITLSPITIFKSPIIKALSRDGVYLSIILPKLSTKYFGPCLGLLYSGNKSHFCFLISILIGIAWMSLGISRPIFLLKLHFHMHKLTYKYKSL